MVIFVPTGPTGGGTTSTSCPSTAVSPPCCRWDKFQSEILGMFLEEAEILPMFLEVGEGQIRVPLIPAYCHFHGWILPSQLQRSPAPQEREVCQQQFFTISYLSSKYEDKCHHQ